MHRSQITSLIIVVVVAILLALLASYTVGFGPVVFIVVLLVGVLLVLMN